MKIVVTHNSPDWDAITSVWLIKRFLHGWEDATIKFVPAGNRLKMQDTRFKIHEDPIEMIKDDEVIHVDTGLGPLDHHQTSSDAVCAASLTWEYIKDQKSKITPRVLPIPWWRKNQNEEKWIDRKTAIDRIVRVVVDIDHFKEVFWPDAEADYHEFSLFGLLEGLKIKNPDQDDLYVEEGMHWLDCIVHDFENRIWAEKEMKEKGQEFETRFGKGLAVETINDSFLKIAQKMGYVLVVRKDPRKGYVRIKARPEGILQIHTNTTNTTNKKNNIDLTLVYEKLKKMDPKATWFLHVSKKMLLNGTPKNPRMVPTSLTLQEIVNVVNEI